MFPEQFKSFAFVEGQSLSADTVVQLEYNLGEYDDFYSPFFF